MARARLRRVTVGAFLAVLSSALWSCSSGDPATPVSDPANGVYVGKILAPDGAPVQGARVSVDGVEADGLTDGNGIFVVSDASLAQAQPAAAAKLHGKALSAEVLEVAVVAPGFEPYVAVLDVAAGAVARIELVRRLLEIDLSTVNPAAGNVFVVPDSCSDATVTVEGIVDLVLRPSYLVDIVVLVDTSGSTQRPAFDVDGDGSVETVIDAERWALHCLLGSLDLSRMRVGVIGFSDAASELASLTPDRSVLEGAIDSLGSAGGGTNFEAAFGAATDSFLARAAADTAAEEADGAAEDGGTVEVPERRRAVIVLSDGVPTTHGVPRDTSDNNLLQSSADRRAAIEAARVLGEETGAEIYAYSIVTSETSDTRFTTLPHCVAVAGGGEHTRIESAADLEDEVCGESLVDTVAVTVQNLTLGLPPVSATLSAGGKFSAAVPVAAAANGDTRENEIVVLASALPAELGLTAETSVTVAVIASATVEDLGVEELLEARKAKKPVSQLNFLKTPTGERIDGDRLYDFLRGEYEDAVEVFGVETFTVTQAGGSVGGNVAVAVDFVFNEACYHSDVGYVVVDPDDLPSTALEALTGATAENVLFNSGDVASGGCGAVSIPAGEQHFEFTMPHGMTVVFFIIPNRTITEYLASPFSGKAPLFSLSRLNPGRFAQAMTFLSENGRTASGASTTIVDPGRKVVVALEDLQIAASNKSELSDRDFADVVVTVSAGVVPGSEEAGCED